MKTYAITNGVSKMTVSAENYSEARKKAVALWGNSNRISIICID